VSDAPVQVTLAVNGGAVAIIGFIVYLYVTGRILAKSTVDRIVATYERVINEKDEQVQLWHGAHDVVKQANDALITQLYQSLEIGRTTNSVLRAVATPTIPAPQTTATAEGGGHETSVA